MPPSERTSGTAILYVASRLPALSETFVYRELLGLRDRGRQVVAASVRQPVAFAGDDRVASIAAEVCVVYARATMLALPVALLRHAGLALTIVPDALRADHPSWRSRAKHVVQGVMGLGLAWRLRGAGIGHVHAHMAHVPATIALYAARALGARFSFTGHAADLFVDRAALRFKLERADFVACISHWHRDFYQTVAQVDAARLPVVRCSVDLPPVVLPENREIVTVARLVAKKGIDLLLRAFASADLPGWTLRILGDGPERGALEALAATLGLGARVRFEGAQPHAMCLAAIRAGGLFVLPCRTAGNGDRDGIPVVLMEAMAAGRAVIAGDLAAIRELVTDGESGSLVPPDDPDRIAAAITRMVADPERRAAMGAAARARVRAEFADAVNLDRLTAAFDGGGGA